MDNAPMSQERLNEIRALRDAISTGNWEAQHYDGQSVIVSTPYPPDGHAVVMTLQQPGWHIDEAHQQNVVADTSFLAASPHIVDDLLTEVERLRVALEYIAQRYETYDTSHGVQPEQIAPQLAWAMWTDAVIALGQRIIDRPNRQDEAGQRAPDA